VDQNSDPNSGDIVEKSAGMQRALIGVDEKDFPRFAFGGL
jgi:hypothetical protein